MSGVNIIFSLLCASSELLEAVPKPQIRPGVLPDDTPLPALGLSVVSGIDRNLANPASRIFVTQRVQVTVLARNYTDQQAVMKLVRKACRDQHGTIAGFAGASVLTDGAGPDHQFGELAGIYMQTQDFTVTFSETP